MPYDVTFTQEVLFQGAMRTIGEVVMAVPDDDARALVDLGVATASGLSPQTGSAAAQFADTFVAKANNFSDISDAPSARGNLGLGSAAVEPASAFIGASDGLLKSNNLSDLSDASASRTNLGLSAVASSPFATNVEAKNGFGSDKVMTPDTYVEAALSGNIFRIYGTISSQVTGTGYGASMSNTYGSVSAGATSIGVTGFARLIILDAQYTIGYGPSYARWQTAGGFGQQFISQNSSTFGNAVVICGHGAAPAAGVATGNPTNPFIGFKQYCNNGNITFLIRNESELIEIPVANGVTNGLTVKIVVRWDGLGNAHIVFNDTTKVTTASAPTSNGTLVNPYWIFELASDGTHTASISNLYTYTPVLFFQN